MKTPEERREEIQALENSYYVALARLDEEREEQELEYLSELKRLHQHGLKLASNGVTFASLLGCEYGL